MVEQAAPPLSESVRDAYLELVMQFPLTSIRSDDELYSATQVLDRLLAEGELDEGQSLYVNALSDLVATYEDHYHAIAPPPASAMLRHLMDATQVSASELQERTGVEVATLEAILDERVSFAPAVQATLAHYFGVDVSVFAETVGR